MWLSDTDHTLNFPRGLADQVRAQEPRGDHVPFSLQKKDVKESKC